ncbi:MAG: hypothetical protein HOA08_16780 [Rhodospirillaceae bacterium]|jgi:hypothetical protein|nr:hypothetical protein [Rhodospirillaceae bacterium]MBT3491936.1 hypothetical protein [Rhodospirillaceae bacterium]MBT3780240.1 hypothetical protein [Rhodospirillaceae bacterium]MBT3978004.1 hypothetical protein [Rhodospirillaceae bacterium]MBT4168094.1 hypothetical protein [Rhodospirillaceae bacterium]
MPEAMVIQPDTEIGAAMTAAAETRRLIFYAGLPGVGKSLFLQQQTLMAARAGRVVHLLQWDIARAAFETEAILAKYPEVDGFTHPIIRKAAGLWARRAVRQWNQAFSDPGHLLIGEVPIVGNRFVELLQQHDDPVEPLLGGEGAMFFVPVPSGEVRAKIEAKRQASIANPKHANESRDAPLNVLEQIWQDARTTAAILGLVPEAQAAAGTGYDPLTYERLFAHMLQHRNCRILHVDTLYPASGSVYELAVPTHELAAPPAEISAIMTELENSHSLAALSQAVADWHRV